MASAPKLNRLLMTVVMQYITSGRTI